MLTQYYERYKDTPEEVDVEELQRLIAEATENGADHELIRAANSLLDEAVSEDNQRGGLVYDEEAAIRELNEKMSQPMWTREEREERERRRQSETAYEDSLELTDEEVQAIINLGNKLERAMRESGFDLGIDVENDSDKDED